MAIWTAEVKEIERLYESMRDQFPELGKELGSLIKTDDENVALLYSRRCLEVIVTDLCEAELKRSRGTEPLKGIIDKLQKEEKVPSHITASMHGLNTLSTFGTHPKDFDPEQVKPVLNNLLIVIKWYLRYKDPVAFSKLRLEEEKYETETATVPEKPFSNPKKRVLLMVSGFLAVVIIAVTILGKFDVINPGDMTRGNKSIAVLPFDNLSNDPDQEYFSVAMVEEILDKLFKIGDLKVIARTSSERFKNTNLSLREIARELGVASILEGSVQKMGNNVRITVQLIDARTETHLWSEVYDKDISDIFSIQSEVAQTVARELKAVITPEAKRLIEKVPTVNMEALDAYRIGKFHLEKLNRADLETAMKFFELALERDPEFARAYSGVSMVWASRQQMGFVKFQEAAPLAEAAIMKALELDSTQSDIHHTLACIKVWTRWDWKGGEASFRKAIELNPNNAGAHTAYSHLLNILKRPDEAMKHIAIALELDPLNPQIKAFYGIDLMFVHRYDDAVKAFQEALELSPNHGVALSNISDALFLAGREDEAMESLRNRQTDPENLKLIEEGYKERGYLGALKKLAEFRAERAKTTYIRPMTIVYGYAKFGDIDNAMYWLEKAYEEHDPNIPYLLFRTYDKLRDDPRFQDLCRRLNLPYK